MPAVRLLAALLVAVAPLPARADQYGFVDDAAASVCALVETPAWRRSAGGACFVLANKSVRRTRS